MQPYYFPYVGYFQLLAAVDRFVVYDNIKYTKKGWINRNRFLRNGKDAFFTLPLKADSDFLHVRERSLANGIDHQQFLNQIKGAYLRAPYFSDVFAMLQEVVRSNETQLFPFLLNSLDATCRHLGLNPNMQVASNIQVDHSLKGQDKVIAICKALGATTYINAIGGVALYDKAQFKEHGIDLTFLKSAPLQYKQFDAAFVPWLSIVDVLMFNPVDQVREYVQTGFQLT